VYVDSPDPTARFFARRIRKYMDFSCKIVAEHKADINYSIVSAASIIAKTERDREIETLAKEYGDIGNGYPHDPKTIRFLNDWLDKHGSMPECCRKSWQTAKDMVNKKNQSTLGDW